MAVQLLRNASPAARGAREGEGGEPDAPLNRNYSTPASKLS